jgi:ABC-type transport system involved in cytochrome c biogenesis permease subunit
MKRFLPALLISFFVLFTIAFLAMGLRKPALTTELDLHRFNELPVQEGGRVKPLDTVARNTLMVISGKQSYKNREGQKIDADEWLAELLLYPAQAADRRVFRIDHPDIVGLLREHNEERKFFSFRELQPHFTTLEEQFALINQNTNLQTSYEKQLSKLRNAINLYDVTASTVLLPPMPEDVNRVTVVLDHLQQLPVQAFPPSDTAEEWQALGTVVIDGFHNNRADPVFTGYNALASAYQAGDAAAFEAALDAQFAEINQRLHADMEATVAFECFYNRLNPFTLAAGLYVLAFLAATLSWLGFRRSLVPTALGIIVVALIVHTFGIWARIEIQGRPPVTNLYSSAIFVGWGAVVLCVILEAIFRNGLASAAAALIGFPTLIVAHHLSKTGDTIEVMRAVLDSNFWLATHVPTVTIGYSATFLAGAFAILYLVRLKLTRDLDRTTARHLESMIYGVVCFATFFSFVGTVLGGIWADQSWGRFWGWDPKENGALMIVLWNALYLHARWGKVVSTVSLMQLAIVGNIITAWSWFGTNMLGVGLHSYGFMDSAFFWLVVFVLSQLLIIATGWLKSPPMREREPLPPESQANESF